MPTSSSLRVQLALMALVLLALVASAPAQGARLADTPPAMSRVLQAVKDQPDQKGIVQSVSGVELTLKELDGTTVTITLDPQTPLSLNGQPASLDVVLPGAVAVIHRDAKGNATAVDIVDHRHLKRVYGLVLTVTPPSLRIMRTSGSPADVTINFQTRLYVNGIPAALLRVKPGCVVTASREGARLPALELKATCPRRP
jgi:hypothetical protein